MSTTPLLAALLGAAFPGLRALDLGVPAPPMLFPWLPGTLLGIADPEALPPGEAALLRRFRHPGGRLLVGFDRAADAALLAGASSAWDGAPERLIRLAADPPHGLPADALLLVPPDALLDADRPRSRVLLLLGAGRTVDRHDLLVPPMRLGAIHAALGHAAEALAQVAGGRWLARALAVAGETASVALLPEDAQAFRPPLSIPAEALVHDLPTAAAPDGLDLSGARHARVLLGTTPKRLRVLLRSEGAPDIALFANGQRLSVTVSAGAAGQTRLEAEPPPSADPAVIGLAVPAHTSAVLTRLELLP
jgi:hypothetical protein